MRNSWCWRAVTSVAIAAASIAWAQAPGGAGSPSAEGTHEPTPKMQGDDAQLGDRDDNANGIANGAPATPNTEPDGSSNGGMNSAPSPRDQPTPGLQLDQRMKRLPGHRDRSNRAPGNGAQGNDAQGSDLQGNGTGNPTAPSSPDQPPDNPANPATPIFPANPHPPADPGEPGNPVTPAALRYA